jgi:Zn-dependent peptidase ImmA (M78 family)
MFTLAHELVHLWLGREGVFNLINTLPHHDETERFCNQTAAEFLVPAHKLQERWKEARATAKPFHSIARWFKVSPVVVARRALDLHLISRATFFAFYEKDQQEWRNRKEEQKLKKGGPGFYMVQDVRLGRKFAYAVVRAAREGRLPYREAYRLTDLKGETFNRYADRLVERMKDERR